MSEIPVSHILFVSTALFFIGMYGLFTTSQHDPYADVSRTDTK
jgi:hypothetical protein